VLDPGVFKAYDVRGLYGSELDEEGAYAIARAYVDQFGPTRIAIGRDEVALEIDRVVLRVVAGRDRGDCAIDDEELRVLVRELRVAPLDLRAGGRELVVVLLVDRLLGLIEQHAHRDAGARLCLQRVEDRAVTHLVDHHVDRRLRRHQRGDVRLLPSLGRREDLRGRRPRIRRVAIDVRRGIGLDRVRRIGRGGIPRTGGAAGRKNDEQEQRDTHGAQGVARGRFVIPTFSRIS